MYKYVYGNIICSMQTNKRIHSSKDVQSFVCGKLAKSYSVRTLMNYDGLFRVWDAEPGVHGEVEPLL